METYEPNHPCKKKGAFIREMPQRIDFFYFFFYFSQGHVYISDEKACLIIKYEPGERGSLEGALV